MFSDRLVFLSQYLNPLSMGVWVVLIAASAAFLGVAVAVAGLNKALNTQSSQTRAIWLGWASISFGIAGIFGPYCLALVGVEVIGSRVRYDPMWLALAGVVAVVGSAIAFVILAPRRLRNQHISKEPQWGRLGISIVILTATIIGSHVIVVNSIEVQGSVYMLIPMAVLATILAVIVAVSVVLSAQYFDGRARRLLATLGITAVLTGMYYCAIFGLDVIVNPAVDVPEGLEMFAVALPGYVLLVLLMMLPITSLLMAPDRISAELEAEADVLAAESAQLERAAN